MSRYFIKLSYKGTNYNGWQVQDNTPNTIQQVLEEKLSMLLQEKIEVVGCGRTDTGVHAKNYIAHFNSDSKDLVENKVHWLYKFNIVLPADISIESLTKVKPEAHARFDALSRTYHYYLHQKKNPFIETGSWYLYGHIDFELMNKACGMLLGTKDFSSFAKSNTQVKTNICSVSYAKWHQINDSEWCFVISSNRFLRNMVRAIVGTLLMVGRNKMTLEGFEKTIEQKKRDEAGMSAPAHGLFLTDIKYPKKIFSEQASNK